ncbi:DUF4843 domain-containing protein [Pedobacter metabolipauper]|uniref:Uncharacterized protein DUF4843 n=1 Tax=Pedobacter metabolipauper TaxID=425513 RepID=A0A4R6SZS0_9SPHI|nr:DUF4843 domain-containing protein [Pedobacter metabolipauper]TDQ10262.1 uncharacterized protein DUF4843 [Pedobacter metabolipauper]
MNKKLLIALLPLLALVWGCEKEIMKYEGNEGVYFAVQHGQPALSINSWPYQPYSNVEFARLSQDEVSFPVKVMITGPVKDYDRNFRVEVNPDSTTAILGVHYLAFPELWTIPANAVSTTIQIRLKRSPDLQNVEMKLGLRLVATEHFALSFPEWDAIPSLTGGTVVPEFDASLHTLRINDIMVKPAVWLGSLQPVNKESGLMGVFTRRKMEFLTQYLGLKYEDFASEATMPMARSILVGSDAAAILIERYNAKNPVLEDDGRLMFIGSVPWTSYIGVPYVPAP